MSVRPVLVCLELSFHESLSDLCLVTLMSLKGLSELTTKDRRGIKYFVLLMQWIMLTYICSFVVSIVIVEIVISGEYQRSVSALWECLYTGHHRTVCTLTHVCSVSHTLSSVSHTLSSVSHM